MANKRHNSFGYCNPSSNAYQRRGYIKMKYLWATVILSQLGIMFIIYIQADNNKQLMHDINVTQTAFAISQANYKRLAERNEELGNANECLIKYSNRDSCITAIKHTPLPKLVKEAKMKKKEL